MDLPKQGSSDFRIFDPAMAAMQGVSVKDYFFLDEHKNLVLFDGWYNKESREMQVNDYYQAMKTDQAV